MTDVERTVLEKMEWLRSSRVTSVESDYLATVSGLPVGIVRRALSGLKRMGLVEHARSWVWIGIGLGGHHVYTWKLTTSQE